MIEEQLIAMFERLAPLLGFGGVGLGIAAILAFSVNARVAARRLISLGLVCVVISAVIPSVAKQVPVWLTLVVLALTGLGLIGLVVAIFIGRAPAVRVVVASDV